MSYQWDNKKPTAQMLGRWQPFHDGHYTLFKEIIKKTGHDRCIFCGGDRTEIARTDFTIYFSEFEYSTGSICKTCYHANAKQVKAV